jgi:hypothetical protein
LRIWKLALTLSLVLLPGLGRAQDGTEAEFDARLLTAQEKRIVQASLVISGDCGGLLDGAWGKGSQAAVMVLGHPCLATPGQGQTVTSGNVSALQGIAGAADRTMISGPIQPGSSGGPLLDTDAVVIGVVLARVDDLAMLETTGF